MGALVDDAAVFVDGRGRAFARRLLHRYGLPEDLADDVAQEALIGVHRAEARGVEIDNVEAFTTELLRRAAIGLSRGERRRPEGYPAPRHPHDAGGDDTVFEGLAAADLPDLQVLAAERSGALRAALAAQLDDSPAAAAGALTMVAVALDGAGPADDCPKPKAGAGDGEAVNWAGLFYAGHLECFPPAGATDDDATRKRRSRAAARQRQLLAAAVDQLDRIGNPADA